MPPKTEVKSKGSGPGKEGAAEVSDIFKSVRYAAGKSLRRVPGAAKSIERLRMIRVGHGSNRRSWSQHGEDVALAERLKDQLEIGFYVDVGANHPAFLSNTWKLYQMGMRGVCVEPNEMLCRLHRRYRPGDVQVNAAAGPCGVAKFYEAEAHVFSSLSNPGVAVRRTSYTPVMPLSSILDAVELPGRDAFSLLSVDTEHRDLDVLKSNDWGKHRPGMVLVEYTSDGEGDAIKFFMDQMGYEFAEVFGQINGLFVRK